MEHDVEATGPDEDRRPSSLRALVPLFVASTFLTLGEGSLQVVLGPYLESQGLSVGLIGTVTMGLGLAALGARFSSGAFYRTGRAPWLVAGGCLAMASSFALLTTTASPVLIMLLLGLDGAGLGVATTAAMAAVLERYPPGANAGSVMGWYTGATGAGYAVAGFVGGPLADILGITSAIIVISAAPLVAGALFVRVLHRTRPVISNPPAEVSPLTAFRTVPTTVWLAFAVAFYIALVNGALIPFFPIHALSIGLTLSTVGTLLGIHGMAATIVRFLSGPLFAVLDYRRTLPWMIAINVAAVVSLSLTGQWWLLAVAWAAIGLSRGVLRVASSVLVMDTTAEAGAQARGAASTVYLAGLDVGKILGPLLGGGAAELVGVDDMFIIVGAAFGLLYLFAWLVVRRSSRSV